MSTAKETGEDPHFAMVVYGVTPRGPGKLSQAQVMTQHKFRVLIPIKQHLSPQLTTGRKIMFQQ